MSITFEKLLSFLVQKASDEVQNQSAVQDNKPTSIRLKPKTRQFINAQATALNTSANSIIETILDGIAESTTEPLNAQLRTMRERFFYLFEAHGLDIPQTVNLLQPLGFTTSALSNTDILHDLLILPNLKWMAETFDVKIEWLSGTQNTPVEDKVRWYKSLRDAAIQLNDLKASNLEPIVMFITRERAHFAEAKKREDSLEELPIGIVVKLKRQNQDGVLFETFQKWQFERWNYAPCRVYAKTLAMYCERHGISAYGYGVSRHELQKLINNEILPVTLLKNAHSSWDPEDYITDHKHIGKDVDELPNILVQYKSSFKGL